MILWVIIHHIWFEVHSINTLTFTFHHDQEKNKNINRLNWTNWNNYKISTTILIKRRYKTTRIESKCFGVKWPFVWALKFELPTKSKNVSLEESKKWVSISDDMLIRNYYQWILVKTADNLVKINMIFASNVIATTPPPPGFKRQWRVKTPANFTTFHNSNSRQNTNKTKQ